MTNFASTYLSGSTGDAEQLESELENSLPSRSSIDVHTAASPGSVSSGSWTFVAGESGITLAADEIMDCWGMCNFSGPTSGETIEFGIFWGGVVVHSVVLAVPTGATGTDGLKQQVAIRWRVVSYSGTSDLELQARRISGVGTFATTNRDVQYYINKQRA